MTGKQGNNTGRCPVCGGRLIPGQSVTIPFLLGNTVAVVKDVPAEVCANCHEPYLTGDVTDQVVDLLQPLRDWEAEVTVLTFPQTVVSAAIAD